MHVIVFLVVIATWGCTISRRGGCARKGQLIALGLLGAVFTLAGGFHCWWNAGVRPDEASPLLFGCSVLILLLQAAAALVAVLGNEGGIPWPTDGSRPSPRQRPSRRR